MASIKDFFDQFPAQTVAEGTLLVSSTQPPKGVFFLKSGHVRLFSISPEGHELTIHIFNPQAFFPLMWAVGEVENTHNFETITPCIITLAPKDRLVDFLQRNPDVTFEMTTRILRGLSGMAKRLEMMDFLSAHDRVLSVIKYLARHFGEKTRSGTVINHYFTHQQIASLVAVSRERVSLEMNKLKKSGLIEYNNHQIILLDPHHAT